MDVVDHFLRSGSELLLKPRDPVSGALLDRTGMTARLIVELPGGNVTLPAHDTPEGFVVALTLLEAAPGSYRALAQYSSGSAWKTEREIALRVLREFSVGSPPPEPPPGTDYVAIYEAAKQ